MPGSARHPTAVPPPQTPTGRTIPGNGRVATVIYHDPDPLAVQLADGMAIGTSSVSPMARGGTTDRQGAYFAGVQGFGTLRFAGKLAQAVQAFTTPVAPINDPKSVRFGVQSGVVGIQGYPSSHNGGSSPLAMMSMHALGQAGLGS